MALVLADRVRETTTTAGSGTITLAGAEAGYQSFAVIGNGNQTYYVIAGDTQWEVGIGTYTSSGTTLSRDTVLSSSDSGNKVTFSAGTKQVFVSYPAEKSVNFDISGNITALSGVITNLAEPVVGSDAATKLYVDTLAAQGISYHEPVKYEVPNTTGNLVATYNNGTAGVSATLTNAGTLAAFVPDGVTASISDRILVYSQTNAYENGVYVVSTVGNGSTAWVLTRAADADTYGVKSPTELGGGDAFFVTSGNTGAGETYICNNPSVIIFGSTAITFAQISSAQVYQAGNGISLTNTTISLATPVSVANGGTGLSTTPTSGQLLIGNGSNYSLSTLTAGSGISITNSAGSITLSATNSGAVTSVTASGPLASSGGATPNISIANTTGTGSVVLDQGATISSATITAAASASITTITGTSANITTVTGTTAGFSSANITQLGSTSATIATLSGTNVTYSNGSFTSATVTNLSSTSANITTLTGTTFGTTLTTHIRGASAAITNISATSLIVTNTIQGSISGNAATATTAANVNNGTLTMNVSGTGLSGSQTFTANQATNATFTVTSNATSANTVSTIVARDASGNFSAGTITATLNGNASTATTASNVNNGTLTMNVSGTGLSGSQTFTANQSGNATFTVTSNATNANTGSTIVARDASGNFSAGTITATLAGNASTASTASALSATTWQRIVGNAINYGSYGSIGVTGTTNTYAGISFSDVSGTLMMNAGATGFYYSNTTWRVYWDASGNQLNTGNVTAYSSDKRLKKNIQTIENPFNILESINGVYFDWDTEECAKWDFHPPAQDAGVLAQDVQKVFPHAVHPAPFDRDPLSKTGSKSGKDYLTVQYEKLVPVLIEAIKELKAEVEALKAGR